MKKLSILIVATVAASLVSCTAQGPKPTLKTDIDSLSYTLGMSRSEGLEGYLAQQGIDLPAHKAEFLKGVLEGINKTSDKDAAYLAGIQIGQVVGKHWTPQLNQEIFGNDSTKTVNKDDMIAGFMAGVKNDTTKIKMSLQEANAYSRATIEAIKEKDLTEKFAENKEAGEAFLAENKEKAGVVTTESGLQYKVITAGKGKVPTADSKVKVHYKGTLIDGTEFDSSYKRNEPTSFRADQVIKGWTEALTLMPVGSKWELYIPQDLAYGARQSGQIPPFSTLVFEVELIDIEK